MTTPEYTKRAVDNYRKKFDMVQIRLEKGCKEQIKNEIGEMSINDYIVGLIKKDIEKRQRKNTR